MSRELLPCPFCGGEAEFNQEGNDYTRARKSIVKCRECKVRMAVGAIRSSLEWTADVVSEKWNTRAPVSVKDEALRIATAKHWRYFNQSSGDAEYCEREAMRVALEAAIPHLAPVSVTDDPRVVELVKSARSLLDVMELHSLPRKITFAQERGFDSVSAVEEFMKAVHRHFRAVLANLEKKE